MDKKDQRYMDSVTQRFADTFKGNDHAYGKYVSGKHFTVTEEPTHSIYKEHITGMSSLGIIPVLKNGTTWFGALDFDNHKEKGAIDITALSQKVFDLGFPAVVCRSKRGGAHMYVFGKEPINIVLMQRFLNKMMLELKGFGEELIEVFPKQKRLYGGAVGNFINLPYFNAKKTERYALIKGEIVNLVQFLDKVDTLRLSNSDIRDILDAGKTSEDMPLCLETLSKEKVDVGFRNVAVYNYAIYAKKSQGEAWQDKVHEFNANNCTEPLVDEEIRKLIASVSGKDYQYKCHEEPCVSRCDRKICAARKYGISKQRKDELDVSELPVLTNLKKFDTDPVLWQVDVDGVAIQLSTDELIEFRLFRKRIFEALNRLVGGKIDKRKWEIIISKLMDSDLEVVDVPEDASIPGLVRALLHDYCGKLDLTASGKDMEDRRLLLQNRPIVYFRKDIDQRVIAFSGRGFQKFVQNNRIGSLAGHRIFLALRPLGIESIKIRVSDKKTVQAWSVPLLDDAILSPNFKKIQIRSDF